MEDVHFHLASKGGLGHEQYSIAWKQAASGCGGIPAATGGVKDLRARTEGKQEARKQGSREGRKEGRKERRTKAFTIKTKELESGKKMMIAIFPP